MSEEQVSPFYNTSAGFGVDTLPGPYTFEGDIRVFPIKVADTKRLDNFLDEYLNKRFENGEARFDRLGSYVLLVATNFFTVRGNNNVGVARSRSLYFHIPVTYHSTCDDGGEKSMRGVVQAFSFSRTIPSVLTSREVRGVNAAKASIHVPRNIQVPDSATNEQRNEFLEGSIYLEDLRSQDDVPHHKHWIPKVFLTLVTKVSDYLGEGVEVRDDVLMEMINGTVVTRHDDSQRPRRDVSKREDDHQQADLSNPANLQDSEEAAAFSSPLQLSDSALTKNSEGEGDMPEYVRNVLCGKETYDIFTLKQFRDAFDGNKACYQSLVLLENRFDIERRRRKKIWPRHIDNPCSLIVYKHRSHPVVESLGLKRVDLEPERRAWQIVPMCAWIVENVERREESGKTLWYRHTREWTRGVEPNFDSTHRLHLRQADEEPVMAAFEALARLVRLAHEAREEARGDSEGDDPESSP